MSTTEPLLKHVREPSRPDAKEKMMSVAGELLQQMKRRCGSWPPPRQQSSIGLPVPKAKPARKTDQGDSAGNSRNLKMADSEAKTPLTTTTNHADRNDQSGFLHNRLSSRERTTQQSCGCKNGIESCVGKVARSGKTASISTSICRQTIMEDVHLEHATLPTAPRHCCRRNLVSETQTDEYNREDTGQIGSLGNTFVAGMAVNLVPAVLSVEDTRQTDGNRCVAGDEGHSKVFDHRPDLEGPKVMGHENWTRSSAKVVRTGWSRYKMASLQSHRVQCCCCAVGVFAAMFGIFMLSAGICIVVNVTLMEVDTSGLPSNLHNESGKKIVGVILICVALAFLSLSATVSILYFTMCSRKSRGPGTATSNGHSRQQRQNPTGAASSGPGLANSRNEALPKPQKGPSSRRDRPHKKQTWRRKNPKPRSVLPPHEEEDMEAARATTELDSADQRRTFYRHKQAHEDKSTDRIASSSIPVPTILVQGDDCNNFLERQLNDGVSNFDEDSVSNGGSEFHEDTSSMGTISQYNTISSDFLNDSYFGENELARFKQNIVALKDRVSYDCPDLPCSIDAETDFSAADLIPERSSPSPLTSDLQGHVMVVRPAAGADLDTPSDSSTSDTMIEEGTDHHTDLPVTPGHHPAIVLVTPSHHPAIVTVTPGHHPSRVNA